ncbi:MAG: alpha/beta hydrolase [Pseudomonadota bacterium]
METVRFSGRSARRWVVPLALLVVAGMLVSFPASAQVWDFTDIKYGTEDPDRQWLNIHLADSDEPTPVYLFAHSNGSTANGMAAGQLEAIASAGYTTVSWESIPTVTNAQELLVVWSDAQVMFDWVRANAATYNIDPDRIVIGGRSRGSGGSWPLAHSGHPAIIGIYMYNALPERFWQTPEVWTPVVDINADSPPTYFAFGPNPQSIDTHNPVNAYPARDRYIELGIGDRITLRDDMWSDFQDANGNWTNDAQIMEFFPAFAATLEKSEPALNISRIVPWSSATYSYSVQTDVVYGQGEVNGGGEYMDLKLDLYIPEVTPPVDAFSQFPLMLMIHGGGFSGGSKSSNRFLQHGAAYAERGWIVASIDYRLMRDDPIPSVRVQALFEHLGGSAAPLQLRTAAAAVDDTLTALDFLHARRDVYAPWTVLFGSSAGAVTALATAYSLDDHGIQRPPIVAVLANWGGMFGSSIGTPFDDSTGTDPVLMVVHGTADPTVPFSQALALQNWAIAAGLPLDFHPVNGAGHGVNLFNTTVPETGESLFQRGVEFIDETVFEDFEQGPLPTLPPGC